MKLKAKGRKSGVKAIFSIERSQQWGSLAQNTQNKWFSKDLNKPTFGAMTALIGYSVSSYVLCDLAEQPYK